MMQAFTPWQIKIGTDLGWKAVEAAVWISAGVGARSLFSSVRSIRPGIVADVAETVKKYFDDRMNAHEQSDEERFAHLESYLKIPHRKASASRL